MIEIFDCQQGTPEWRACRLGIPTASEFHSVLAQGEGKTRRTLMLKLIGEQLTGESQENFSNVHTERGHLMEADVRDLVSFDYPKPPQQVGFVRRAFGEGFVGCSPDSLVGLNGVLEIKTKLPHLQLEVVIKNRLPPEHVAQCQGALWVTGREWLDFVSYWPGLPLFKTRVLPDLEYFAKLEAALTAFNMEMADIIKGLPPVPLTRLPKKVPQINVATEFTSLD